VLRPTLAWARSAPGFTSVMMDGSLKDDAKTPADYTYNLAVAHAVGVSVEAELGCLGSLETLAGDKEDGHGADGKLSREQLLTDPDEAARFVDETQCDALAIAIGTSHGAYKFKRQPTGAVDRIKAIHQRLPNTHLVMHGSSSVPQHLLEEIRCYGGDIRETYGVPVAEIREGIRHGVCKVNIDTDIRLAMTAAMRRTMKRTATSSIRASSCRLRWTRPKRSVLSASRRSAPLARHPIDVRSILTSWPNTTRLAFCANSCISMAASPAPCGRCSPVTMSWRKRSFIRWRKRGEPAIKMPSK